MDYSKFVVVRVPNRKVRHFCESSELFLRFFGDFRECDVKLGTWSLSSILDAEGHMDFVSTGHNMEVEILESGVR